MLLLVISSLLASLATSSVTASHSETDDSHVALDFPKGIMGEADLNEILKKMNETEKEDFVRVYRRPEHVDPSRQPESTVDSHGRPIRKHESVQNTEPKPGMTEKLIKHKAEEDNANPESNMTGDSEESTPSYSRPDDVKDEHEDSDELDRTETGSRILESTESADHGIGVAESTDDSRTVAESTDDARAIPESNDDARAIPESTDDARAIPERADDVRAGEATIKDILQAEGEKGEEIARLLHENAKTADIEDSKKTSKPIRDLLNGIKQQVLKQIGTDLVIEEYDWPEIEQISRMTERAGQFFEALDFVDDLMSNLSSAGFEPVMNEEEVRSLATRALSTGSFKPTNQSTLPSTFQEAIAMKQVRSTPAANVTAERISMVIVGLVLLPALLAASVVASLTYTRLNAADVVVKPSRFSLLRDTVV